MSGDGRERNESGLHGVIAEFVGARELLDAAEFARAAGYTRMDAYSPFPIDGLAEAVGMQRNRVPLIVLLGGIAGGGFAYFMLWYINVVDYPLNVGGRPFHSWPSFIPITFELTVLVAAFAAVLGMLILNRLPELHHPVFGVPGFERASQDRFFLCIEAKDPRFDAESAAAFLLEHDALSVHMLDTGSTARNVKGTRRA